MHQKRLYQEAHTIKKFFSEKIVDKKKKKPYQMGILRHKRNCTERVISDHIDKFNQQ